MSNNVIAAVPLSNETLVVWFEGGVSKCYKAQDLDYAGETPFAEAVAQSNGEGITWADGTTVGANELIQKGEEVDFVANEKYRLLKDLSTIRRDASFSQTRLGEAAGIRQSVISRIEGCEISPQINTLLKLLGPLGKTLAIVDLQ